MADDEDAELELAEIFGAVARSLLAESDLQPTLDRIVQLAVATIDSCDHCGITLVTGRRLSSPAPSDEVPRFIDVLQEETDQGPCLDAIREHEVFCTGSLSTEGRWPEFARRAHDETGVQSILSIRLFVEEDTLGALNLYSKQPDAFDEHDIAIGSVFAAHAAVAMSTARERENLHRAIKSRDVIGRAKGILSTREHISDDAAFDVLKRASQRLNIKLAEVARRVTEENASS